eukprot:597460-Pleurochrysis_carterae.AAC.1
MPLWTRSFRHSLERLASETIAPIRPPNFSRFILPATSLETEARRRRGVAAGRSVASAVTRSRDTQRASQRRGRAKGESEEGISWPRAPSPLVSRGAVGLVPREAALSSPSDAMSVCTLSG